MYGDLSLRLNHSNGVYGGSHRGLLHGVLGGGLGVQTMADLFGGLRLWAWVFPHPRCGVVRF